MKLDFVSRVRPHGGLLPLALVGLFGWTAWGSVQPAWIVSYNGGLANSTNQVVRMSLDGQGNIVLAGSATGAAGDYDYLTLKYAPDGRLLWSARYASVSNLDDQVHAMGLDSRGDVFLTGSSVTVKYSSAGALEWTAPFAGRDLAVGTDGSVYVTGFSTTDFGTAKLTSEGSNVWVRTEDLAGLGRWDRSDKVALDAEGHVYVAGPTVWICYGEPLRGSCYIKYGLVKYDAAGNLLWTSTFPSIAIYTFEVVALVSHGPWIYYCGHGDSGSFATFRIGSGGDMVWGQSFLRAIAEGAAAMAVYSDDAVYVAGSDIVDASLHVAFVTLKADATGNLAWQATYNNGVPGYHRCNAIAVDDAGNIYVTGRSENTNGDSDWATIKYNPAGREQWVRRYDGPAHGLDEGRAITVDASGAVYVAGTQTATNGSIETVLIKYVDLTNIELLPSGIAVLRFAGTAGAPCRLQASTDLADWSDLRNGVVGNDGIARFEDTNAPASLTRFYRMVSP